MIMSVLRYKFKCALEYDTIFFDGLYISVEDFKNALIKQKRLGKSRDNNLQITNAQTKEVYTDENSLIPRNSLIWIARIPKATQSNRKQWKVYNGDSFDSVNAKDADLNRKAIDLSKLDASEDDKIKAMMYQSTRDYDPSSYQKMSKFNQSGPVPPTYRCYKCHQPGHWIKDCTYGQGKDALRIKKSSGIPCSFMVPVEGPQVRGAMMTPNGTFAVAVLDHEVYNCKPTPAPVMKEPKREIPENLICSICSDILTDAVMIPCCGNSFCDGCIRNFLIESEDEECPDCHENNICPTTVIPNRYLRKAVADFMIISDNINKTIIRPPPRDTTPVKKEENMLINSKSPKVKVEPQNDGPPVDSQNKHLDRGTTEENENIKKEENYYFKEENSNQSQCDRRLNNEDLAGSTRVDESGINSRNFQYSSEFPPTSSNNSMPISNTQGPPTNEDLSIPHGYQPINIYSPLRSPLHPYFGYTPQCSVPYMSPGPYGEPPRPILDPTWPSMTGALPLNSPSHHRDYEREIRNGIPTGIIEDTLAVFNEILREKDERNRRDKARLKRTSRSKSRCYSPSSTRRVRSRSARRRSRSRSSYLSSSSSRKNCMKVADRDFDDMKIYHRNKAESRSTNHRDKEFRGKRRESRRYIDTGHRMNRTSDKNKTRESEKQERKRRNISRSESDYPRIKKRK